MACGSPGSPSQATIMVSRMPRLASSVSVHVRASRRRRFEQRHVGGREAVAIQLEELDADHASFMVALHPQEIDQANELVAGERGQGRCKRWRGHSPRGAHALLAERIDRQVDGTSRVS